MERLALVPSLPDDFETPIVTEIRPPRKRVDFGYLRNIVSLPDNVYVLHPPEPPESPLVA